MKKQAVLIILTLVVLATWANSTESDSTRSSVSALPDFETTSQIRDSVGTEVDWGTTRTQLNMKVFTNDSKKLSRIFRYDEGAVMCQGAAYYLHLKYLEAGYRSYVVGFKSDLFSHAMVLVEVERKDRQRALIVQDPSFNLSYVASDGQPLSIFEIMSELARGNHRAISIAEGKPAEVDFLRHPSDPNPLGSTYVEKLIGPSARNPKFTKYRATISIAAFSNALEQKINEYCLGKGLDNSLLYAVFGRPIYVHRKYPMDAKDKADAAQVFYRLVEHYEQYLNIQPP